MKIDDSVVLNRNSDIVCSRTFYFVAEMGELHGQCMSAEVMKYLSLNILLLDLRYFSSYLLLYPVVLENKNKQAIKPHSCM